MHYTITIYEQKTLWSKVLLMRMTSKPYSPMSNSNSYIYSIVSGNMKINYLVHLDIHNKLYRSTIVLLKDKVTNTCTCTSLRQF